MTETARAPREKLSITRPVTGSGGVIPHPRIEQGLERARDRQRACDTEDAFRPQANDNPFQSRTSAAPGGNTQDLAIAALLDPVRHDLGLCDDGAASLEAFTRKLLEGGRPRRSNQF